MVELRAASLMSLATPPKWPTIWSAAMIESAIVIIAWRSSCPWFQRKSTWWMATPVTPTQRQARTSGPSQAPNETLPLPKPVVEAPESPEMSSCSEKAM